MARRKKPHVKNPRVIQRESTSKRIIEQGRVRLLCIGAVFALSFTAIGVRLVEVTFVPKKDILSHAIPAGSLENKANGAQESLRRDIIDRNGLVIATSLATQSLFANPRIMHNNDETIKELTHIFPELSPKTLKSRLNPEHSFVWIKRNLTPKEQQAVNALGIPGLYFLPEEKRVYPYGMMFSHVLGYVGLDNAGLSGVEKYFDATLKKEGPPLALALDVRLQHILRDEVVKTVVEFKALGAVGIIVDVKSDEILAMVSLPDFDPHFPARASDEQKFNRATLGTYEMGSTFKTFTVAAALDYGVVDFNDGYDATHPIHIGRFKISDSHPKARWLSVPEIYTYSSNIGTVKMAMDLGTERQKTFLRKLGLFKPVSLELPELSQPLYPKDWKPINSMTISFGHGMSISPMHLTQAVTTLVGDGKEAHLTLLKRQEENHGMVRVVSEETSRAVRRLMRLVVKHGTGEKANVDGYRVGGKTGTAEKVVAGGYNRNAKISSFIATFPVDDPRYVMLVMVDEAKGNSTTHGYATGGWIAAPTVARVIERMAPMLAIQPQTNVAADDAERYWVNEPTLETKHPAVTMNITPAVYKQEIGDDDER